MKRSALAIVIAALALGGCANYGGGNQGGGVGYVPIYRMVPDGFNPFLVRTPDGRFPNVFVIENRYVVVDQEPAVVFLGDAKRVTISWALPFGSPYSFTDKGVEFRAEGDNAPINVDCKVAGSQKKTFACSFEPRRRGLKIPYTIRVTDGKETFESDPLIMPN